LLLLLTILSCVCYFRYLKNPGRANGLGWLLISVAALYTQYMAGVVLAFQLLHLLLFAPRKVISCCASARLSGFCALAGGLHPAKSGSLDVPLFYQSGLPTILTLTS